MKSFHVWALGALTLLSVGWLQADTISPSDGGTKLKSGGVGSITFSTTTCTPSSFSFEFAKSALHQTKRSEPMVSRIWGLQ